VKDKSASAIIEANGEFGQAETAISSQSSPISLLAELQQAHEMLLDAMDAVDVLTRGQVPAKARLTAERWKLSKASLARRMLWGKILTSLSPGLSGDRNDALRRLQEWDINLLRASTHHVSKWTTEAALANWSGYCAASRSIRRKMAANVDAEKRILYPMLETGELPPAVVQATTVNEITLKQVRA
jgi:hypothetical protein